MKWRTAVLAATLGALVTACASSSKDADSERMTVTAARTTAQEVVTTEAEAVAAKRSAAAPRLMMPGLPPPLVENREAYQSLQDNPVKVVTREPVSTFSIDVDTGAYSNVRRHLRAGKLPPADAVRVEELLNYFPYADSVQRTAHPFTVQTEVAPSPWKPGNQLLRIRIKAVDEMTGTLPPANLVFLVDVSGSMASPDKLPLVQATLKMLVKQLRAQDRIALVVYAGRTQVELPSTPGDQQETILAAIDRLTAGGATAGEAAMTLAYGQARAGFIPGGINRILMATDGDFNVGVTDLEQLKDMVARERRSGVSLTMLGFGTGNYNDYLMEQLADIGNGNFAYIDSVDEGRKVLIDELRATLNTVASDVKLQVEFNPNQIAEYRLIGYENRMLREEDFNNDNIDAGEIGAGKTVTALYELTPVGAATLHEPLRYQTVTTSTSSAPNHELAYLRIRYKPLGADNSTLLSHVIAPTHVRPRLTAASSDFRFAAAVASFGQLLRGGPYLGTFSYDDITALAQSGLDNDDAGYRREFVRLVQIARDLARPASAPSP